MSRRDATNEPSKTLPGRSAPGPLPVGDAGSSPTVFVPAPPQPARARRWPWFLLGFAMVVTIAGVAVMVAWPRLRPRKLDTVERVAESYLKALADDDTEAARRLSIVEEPPAIRSVGAIRHDRRRSRIFKGSFAPLGAFHKKVDAEYTYETAAGRFTPKNLLGPAGETLDALHAAKEQAEKSGLAKKIESGDPNDLFDAAEEYAKVFSNLAVVLRPRRSCPPTRCWSSRPSRRCRPTPRPSHSRWPGRRAIGTPCSSARSTRSRRMDRSSMNGPS